MGRQDGKSVSLSHSLVQRWGIVRWSLILLLGLICVFSVQAAADEARLDLRDAMEKGVVKAHFRGKGTIDSLSATLSLVDSPNDVTIVMPVGTYLTTSGEREEDAFWSCDSVVVPFVASARRSVDIPVVKAVFKSSTADVKTYFSPTKASSDRIPRLLAYMAEQNMSHAARQVAVGILYDPAMSRDTIDEMYHTRTRSQFSVFDTITEAVHAEDPVYAFMALEHTGVQLKDLKLYTELASLVHALGSREAPVRQYALAKLGEMDAVNPAHVKSQDYIAALIDFIGSSSRSIRYRAVLALARHPESRVIAALIPLVTDNVPVYHVPDPMGPVGIGFGQGTPRTIGRALRTMFGACRSEREEDLMPLLLSPDTQVRRAGVEVFAGSQSDKVKAMLTELATQDDDKGVRDAAEKALGIGSSDRQGAEPNRPQRTSARRDRRGTPRAGRDGVDAILDELDLTDEQRGKTEEIQQASAEKMRAASEAEAKAKTKAFRLSLVNATEAEIVAVHGEVGRLMGETAILRMKMVEEIRAALTAEQKTKFEERLRQRTGQSDFRMRMVGRVVDLSKLFQGLDLSPEQNAKIQRIQQASADRIQNTHEGEFAAIEKLRKLETTGGSEESIRATATEVGKKMGDSAAQKGKITEEMKAVLTPEQRTEFEEERKRLSLVLQ